MPVRVAINGFGRVGRSFMRAAHAQSADIEVVAVNDLAAPTMLAQLLKYDSVYGRFDGEVVADEGGISIDGVHVRALAETDPAALPWAELGVDVVIESTGRFRTRAAAAQHLEAGARKVIISAPAKGDEPAGRDGRARSELRSGLRRRPPPRHLQRLVHDELPRPGGQGAARDRRDQARPDDHRACLHVGSEPAGRPRIRTRAARVLRRSTSSPHPPEPPRLSAW